MKYSVSLLLCFKDEYNDSHGGKWPLSNLKLYLECTQGKEVK